LRRTIGFAIDLVVHVGGAVGVALALTHVPRLAHYASYQLPAAVGTFLALSIVHRVVVQWGVPDHGGKALGGVCLIRDDTGGRPTLWSLAKEWLFGAVAVAAILD
jgi:hypothetical protein